MIFLVLGILGLQGKVSTPEEQHLDTINFFD